MHPKLDTGVITRILGGDTSAANNPFVVQVLGIKQIPGTGNDRYRLLISDGESGCPFAMLATQFNHMITSKEIDKFTVIKVLKCVCNNVPNGDKKVMILLNLAIVAKGSDIKEKIGNPITQLKGSEAIPSNNGPDSTNQTRTQFGSTATAANGSDVSVHPIASLTPYQNKWTIKARVTSKTPLRSYSNSRGEGKVFSVNLLDESAEIRATGFNDAADKYYDMLEVNKVFYISKGSLKTANAKFSSVKNEYEMTFNNDTTVAQCEENDPSIPSVQFDFKPIAEIEQIEKDSNIDVIGICKSYSDLQTFTAKTSNKEFTKRDIKLVDRSNKEVSLTLWGSDAEKFEGGDNPVIAVKGARVSDFNGKSLSVSMSSTLQVNPDIKEAHILKGWYEREGSTLEAQSISGRGGGGGLGGQWKTFAQAVSEQLGIGEKPDYFMNKATIVMLKKENCMYMACPGDDCNKKVVDMNNGTYRCEKCNREYTEFKWRLLLQVSLADFTDNQWATCFQESAEQILDVSAQELGSLKETDEERFNEILTEANFKSYIFKLRTKMETYNEESRLKTTVFSVTPLDPVSYTRKLISDIKEMQKN